MRKKSPFLIIAICLVFLGASLQIPAGLFEKSQVVPRAMDTATPLANLFDANAAYNDIQSQLDFGFRIPGTPADNECAQWICSQLNNYGSAAIYNFTFTDTLTNTNTLCQNVIGKMNVGHPKIIVFAAHYDSRNVSDHNSNGLNLTDHDPGANDGGSGIAVMLEIAHVLYESAIQSNYEFWFIAFDAEDQGADTHYSQSAIPGWNWCEGSTFMATDMVSNPGKYFSIDQTILSIQAFILLDMVGGTDLQFIQEQFSNTILLNALFSTGQSLGYNYAFPSNPVSESIIDDHVAFRDQGIPTADLINAFWDFNLPWHWHHTSNDTLQNIDPTSLNLTGRTLLEFITQYYLANSTETLSINTSPNQIFGIADYAYIFIVMILAIGVLSLIIYFKKKKNDQRVLE